MQVLIVPSFLFRNAESLGEGQGGSVVPLLINQDPGILLWS